MSDPGPENLPTASFGVVCPGYFHTAGIPLLAGRDFQDRDRKASTRVAIINDTFRRRWSVMVRTDGPPMAQLPAVRLALRRAAPADAIGQATTMDEILEGSLGYLRFPMVLFTVFAGVALLLAGLGCFGVAMQAVVQRRRELAIRRALGARPASIAALVLRQTMTPVTWGLGLGILGAFGGTRLLRGLLFGVEATDPKVFAVGALLLGLLTVGACLLPAGRAARVDPASVLRED